MKNLVKQLLGALFILSFSACAQPENYSNVSNDELVELLHQDVTLIDIRRPEEWAQTGTIKGSQKITLFDQQGRIVPDFVEKLSAIAKPEQPVALICRTGSRTRVASQILSEQLGYKTVYNVTHGITGWIKEGRPVAR